MHPGAPSRLSSSYPLRRALDCAHPGGPLGAWVRAGRCPAHLRAGGCALLIANDLGWLLRRCARILLRVEQQPAVLPAETLIAWRTLQVAVGAPYLPPRARLLSDAFPGLTVSAGRLSLPIGLESPEPALAACAAARVPVAASWIEYRASDSG